MAQHWATCLASAFQVTFSRIRAAPDFPCAIPTQLQMLHSVVEPAGLYGCQLWGLGSVPGLWSVDFGLAEFYALRDPVELSRCRLLKKWLHLPVSTPSLCMLHELGCQPLVHHYVRCAVRFYNALVDMSETSVYRGILIQNVEDGLGNPAAKNFVGALFQVLRVLSRFAGLELRQLGSHLRALQPLPLPDIEQALVDGYLSHVRSFHGLVTGSGSRIGYYFRCVAGHKFGKVPHFYELTLSQKVLMGCLRFRLGSHHLHVNTGRWCAPPIPRSERTCKRCTQHLAVDDETHCVLHCTHPILVAGRARLSAAFAQAGCLDHGHPINTFEHFCHLWGRKSVGGHCSRFIALCSRVTWRCYTHGGSDIPVELPEWWANLPDSLDLFDSSSSASSRDMLPDLLDTFDSE